MRDIPLEELIVRPSFAMPFGNGEIWFEELDALARHSDLAVEKLRADMRTVAKPSTPALVAVNLKDTLVSRRLAAALAEELAAAGGAVRRVGFVGLGFAGKRRLKAALRAAGAAFVYAFYADLEQAKHWLVGG